MKKPVRGKYPKKPALRKPRKAPKLPKGGIKSEAQADAYEKRKKDYKAHCKAIESENGKRMKVWNDAKKKIDNAYNAKLKKYNDFQKRVAKIKAL